MSKNLKEGYLRSNEPETKRYCQFLKLNPDTLDQYKYWHESKNVWKEIPQGIRKAGILDMEIYVINDLAFMIVETPVSFDWNMAFGQLETYDRQVEWEEFVGKFQISEEGKRSDEKWHLIDRVFSLQEALK